MKSAKFAPLVKKNLAKFVSHEFLKDLYEVRYCSTFLIWVFPDLFGTVYSAII